MVVPVWFGCYIHPLTLRDYTAIHKVTSSTQGAVPLQFDLGCASKKTALFLVHHHSLGQGYFSFSILPG
jgi:hypothetical protein